MLCSFSAIAQAQVYFNRNPTGNIYLGDLVTFELTDVHVGTIEFRWYKPGDWITFDEIPGAFPCYMRPKAPPTFIDVVSGPPYTSCQTPNCVGQWFVNIYCDNADLGGTRWTGYPSIYSVFTVMLPKVNVVPEFPLIGTLSAGIAMMSALAVFRIERKRPNKKYS
jgi:hypothetical protein